MGAAADMSPYITSLQKRIKGYFHQTRHEILDVFYSDIFKGMRVLGTWLLLT